MRGCMQAPVFGELMQRPPGAEPYMPAMTPFQVLLTDCTALGAGTQLKRGVLSSW